jgi:hypothetical protein
VRAARHSRTAALRGNRCSQTTHGHTYARDYYSNCRK